MAVKENANNIYFILFFTGLFKRSSGTCTDVFNEE
jgi:hypothetical protein